MALDGEIEPDRERLTARLLASGVRWQAFIDTLSAECFDGALDYITMQDEVVSLPFALTLMHTLNHATHHRG